jgi:hypothetical protein
MKTPPAKQEQLKGRVLKKKEYGQASFCSLFPHFISKFIKKYFVLLYWLLCFLYRKQAASFKTRLKLCRSLN